MDPVDDVRITGFQLTNWKCFKEATLNDLRDVNIFIGQNNVGKSALLLGLRRLTRLTAECVPLVGTPDGAGAYAHLHTFRTHDGDVTDDTNEGQLQFSVSLSDARFSLAEDFPYLLERDNPGAIDLDVVLGTGKFPHISLSSESFRRLLNFFAAIFDTNNRPDLAQPQSASSVSMRCGIAIASALAKRIIYVPHEREIRASLDEVPYSQYEERRFSGHDAIRRLAQWRLSNNERNLSSVEAFVSNAVGYSVRIRPTLEPAVEVKLGDRRWRNLKQLGAGLSQLVVLGVATQLTSQSIAILEEPEISLHPRLQRSFIHALPKFCAQAFITTHSNNLVDNIGLNVALHHVRAVSGNRAIVQRIGARVIEVMRDLGVRPSSLAQANTVLWVEGPSDAIYVRYWLSKSRPDLIEGTDFVFAFHAGALLAHSTEKRAGDFVSVISEINQNYFLVLDSDPNEDGAPGHAYAEPWIDHVRSWMTEPKEIEGYVSDEALLAALDRNESRPESDTLQSLRDRLIQLGLPKSWSKQKVELARLVVGLDGMNTDNPRHSAHLLANLTRIVDFIIACRDTDAYIAPDGSHTEASEDGSASNGE